MFEIYFYINNLGVLEFSCVLTTCIGFITLSYFTCTSYANNVGSHIVRTLRYLFYFKLA